MSSPRHSDGVSVRDAEESGAEELVDVAGPDWLRTPGRRRAAAGLALAVLVAAVGVRLSAGHHSTHRAVPLPTSQPVPSRSAFTPRRTVLVFPGKTTFDRDDPDYCPTTITCLSVHAMPVGVLAAVREYLPDAVFSTHESVLQLRPDRVYYRQIIATAGGVTLLVLVYTASAQQVDPAEEAADRGGVAAGYVRTVAPGGYEVQVQFNGPRRSTPPLAAIRALAADPRLIALS